MTTRGAESTDLVWCDETGRRDGQELKISPIRKSTGQPTDVRASARQYTLQVPDGARYAVNFALITLRVMYDT